MRDSRSVSSLSAEWRRSTSSGLSEAEGRAKRHCTSKNLLIVECAWSAAARDRGSGELASALADRIAPAATRKHAASLTGQRAAGRLPRNCVGPMRCVVTAGARRSAPCTSRREEPHEDGRAEQCEPLLELAA